MTHSVFHNSPLLIVALAPEWTFLKKKHTAHPTEHKNLFSIANTNFHLFQCGFGLTTSGVGTAELFQKIKPTCVIHFGCSGALIPELSVGDLLIPDQICNTSASITPDPILQKKIKETLTANTIKFHTGTLFSSETVLKNLHDKRAAHSQTNANQVDMESFAIAGVCKSQRIPYVSIRAIFDDLADNIESIGEPYSDSGELSASKLTVNLIKSPKLFLSLPGLKRRSEIVQNSLNQAIDVILKIFHGSSSMNN